MTNWLQLHIDVNAEQVPGLEQVFENLGALSVTLGAAGDERILEPEPGDIRLWGQTRITALFDGACSARNLRDLIAQHLSREISEQVRFERVEDRIWERVWLETWRPMVFGERLWVHPAGQRPQANGIVTVQLDPGLAFGTGTHASTASCLQWLDSAELSGKSVTDYGCGSGILAIAALRLGAARAIAIDRDPQALEATQRNAKINRVLDRLSLHDDQQAPALQTDVLLANILAGPLIALRDTFKARLRPGGTIVLAGILEDQAEALCRAYCHDFDMHGRILSEEWVLLHGKRRV